jgi:hypothetical protein
LALSKLNRRQQWRKVLDLEMHRWSTLPYAELMAQLRTVDAYEIGHDSKRYQVEIDVLENTEKYIHVAVSVDDGSLPASLWPVTDSFILEKSGSKA